MLTFVLNYIQACKNTEEDIHNRTQWDKINIQLPITYTVCPINVLILFSLKKTTNRLPQNHTYTYKRCTLTDYISYPKKYASNTDKGEYNTHTFTQNHTCPYKQCALRDLWL